MRASRQQPSISIQQEVSKSLDVHSSNSQRNEQLSWSLSRSFNENTRLTQLLRSLHQATQKNNNGNSNNNSSNANRFNFISQQQFLAPSVTSATTRKAGKAKSRVDSSETSSMNNRHSEIERLQNTSQTSKHQQQQHQSQTLHNDNIHIKPTTTISNNNKEQYYQHNQLFEQKGNILLNSYLNATIEAKAENAVSAGRSTRYKGSSVVSQSQQHSAREQKLRSIYGLRPQTTYSAQGNYCNNEAEGEAEIARRNAVNQQYKSYSVNSNKHTTKESTGGVGIPKSGGQLRRSYHLEKGSSQQQQQQQRPGKVVNPLLDTIDVSLRTQVKPIDNNNNINYRNTNSRASNHSNNTSIEAKTKPKNSGATEIWKDLLTMQSQQQQPQQQQTNKNAIVQNYLLNYNNSSNNNNNNSKDTSINSTIQHSNEKITIHSSNNNGNIRSSSRTGRERANSSSKAKNQQTQLQQQQQINGQLTKDRSKTIDVDTTNTISRKIPYAKVARTSRYASVNNNNNTNHNNGDSSTINSSINNITGIIDGITTTKTKTKAKTITPMIATGNNHNNIAQIQPLAPRSTENNNNNNNTKQKKTLRSLIGGAEQPQQVSQSQTQSQRVAAQQKASNHNNNGNNLHNIANLLREQENIYLGRERMLQQQHNVIDAHNSDNQTKTEEQHHNHNHSTTSAIPPSSSCPFSMKITSRSKQGVLASNPAKPNQDSLLILENLCGVADWTLFVVCDGHGTLGHLVSQFVVMNLQKQLLSDQQMLRTNPRAALFNAVGMTNHYLVNSAIDTTYSGTTLVCVLIQGTQLYTANVGDSRATRAIVETTTATTSASKNVSDSQKLVFLAEALTIDQKPSIPSEAARIYDSNGRIDSFRDKQGNQLGPLRVWLKDYNTPGLAMSRSLGDDVATSVGVTWEPEIDQYEITDSDKFLIVGSDGLWEFIDDDKAVGMVQQHYVDMDIEGGIDELMKESYKQWTMEDNSVIDDTTVILVFFIRNNNNNNNQAAENSGNISSNQGKNNKNYYEL